ncbi:MAG: RluA family pseudouridine synthase [Clostridia bacterium]|nr:RluA family pseudouridine synthase [Clostridia bacterium]
MIKIIVEKSGDNKKIVSYLQNQFHTLSSGTIYKALRNKDIRVNDVKIKENVTIHAGDEITLYIKDELLYGSSANALNVVYEDENIIVVNKPQEIIVVSDKNERGIDKQVEEYCKLPYVRPCHRLDRNTSGLVIFAKNEMSEKAMLAMIKEKMVKKYYRALVCGVPQAKDATLTAYLFKDAKKSVVLISDEPKKGYQKIITKYQLLKKNPDGTSLLEVELITGRTHQIRAHLAHIGHPIIGDGKYGVNQINKQFGKNKQELQAYKLVFEGAYAPLEYLKGKEIKI